MDSVHVVRFTDYMTLGDVCEAISDRELPATVEDGFYVVSRRDLKRLIEPEEKDCPASILELLPHENALAAG